MDNEEVPGRVGFGQYALSKWRDLPDDYLRYLISDKCKTTEENKAKARKEILIRDRRAGPLRYFNG